MKKVIIDTNFLLVPYQFKIDIFSEIKRVMDEPFEIRVLEGTIDELNKIIAEQTGKSREAAKLALKLLKNKGIKTLKTEKHKNVDKILQEIADKDTVIATNDIPLKKALKAKDIKIIVMRQKKYLALG